MSPYFSYEAPSAFGDLSQSSIGVLVTNPAGHEWYVIMDKKSAMPLFETDSLNEAKEMADAHAAISDLAFFVRSLADESAIVYVESSLGTAVTNDGLQVIPDAMIRSGASANIGEAITRAAASSRHWETWDNGTSALASHPRSLVFSMDMKVPPSDDEGTHMEYSQVIVMAEMDWSINDLRKIDLKVLDGDYKVNGKPLHRLLHEIEISPDNEVWIESPDELEDWIGVTERMPLFTALHKPDRGRIYAYEGGPVLKSIAATRPWMVEKDAEGNPVPLRIREALDYEVFNEEGLKDDQHFLASIFLQDQLAAEARAKLIKAQEGLGITPGQVTPQGTFVKVAEIDSDVTLEAMFDRKTPNIIGTRDWLNYRLWVSGELVLDVHPGNPSLYPARTVGISPMQGAVDPENFSLTSEQVGDLLATALVEVDPDDDQGLPERVIRFLQSSRCEELNGDAQALEAGEAVIEGGKLVRLDAEGHDQEHSLDA